MKILIAGGAGYVSSVLIPRLLDRGYKVDVVYLFWFGNQSAAGSRNPTEGHLSSIYRSQTWSAYEQVISLAGLSNESNGRVFARARISSSTPRRPPILPQHGEEGKN